MRFDRLDLNLLRVLDALLVGRNVTRTAEQLNVTPQAISNSLKRLRQEFDDPLLIRVGHGMELTPLAASLLEPLREALLRLEIALRQRPSFDPATTTRTFRLTMPHYHSFVLLPQVLRILAAEAPRISLQIQPSTRNDIAALEAGDIDFSLVEDGERSLINPRRADQIRRHPLVKDDFVCLVDRARFEPDSELAPDVYERLSHCVMRPTPDARMQVEREWQRLGIAPHVSAIAPGYAVMTFILPDSGLVATLPRRVARVFARPFGLRTFECPVPLGHQRGELRWHRRNDGDPAHGYLCSTIRGVAAREDERVGIDAEIPRTCIAGKS